MLRASLISNRKSLIAIVLWGLFCFQPLCSANVAEQQNVTGDTVKIEKKEKGLKRFVTKLKKIKPLGWIIRNWSAYDPRYSTPSFYHWAGQLQDNIGKEYSYMNTGDGTEFKMRSRTSNKLGPYLSYNWLGYGLSIDLNTIGKSKDRSKAEFGLSINSNLFNIDLFYRRTGGDYTFNTFKIGVIDPQALFEGGFDTGSETVDLSRYYRSKDFKQLANANNLGSLIKCGIMGININHFLNHRKYSNPAAFSNGAIQLRSVGSPIVGLGFAHQTYDLSISQVFFNGILSKLSSISGFGDAIKEVYPNMGDDAVNGLRTRLDDLYDNNRDQYYKEVGSFLRNPKLSDFVYGRSSDFMQRIYDKNALEFLFNSTPSHIRINDLHLQLGYAYNLVFSKRLLLGLSAIASPSIKWVHVDNNNGFTSLTADDIAAGFNDHFEMDDDPVSPSEFRYSASETSIGINAFGRASLTYNLNRWRAGFNMNVNAYLFNRDGFTANQFYGNCNIYVGYCFGRKKRYRYDGKDRKAYIMAALTNSQIEEMKDTLPKSNLARSGNFCLAPIGKGTKYHTDNFHINICGSDLCKGPDGLYGSFRITDGYVSEGQDSEGRLSVGNVLPLEKNGSILVTAGHKSSFRAGNWWKSHLSVHQNPMNWYPEMLHYALKGTLSLWVRDHEFGTDKPVLVTIPDFYINHGVETKEFFQIGAQNFESHSAYSIVGYVTVNGRICRLYIESKKRGKRLNFYINPMRRSFTEWMKPLPDTRPISQIDIPGTHDAGTASLPETTITSQAHTQNFTISEQVFDGIRAFDIRLKEDMRFGHTLACRESFDSTMKEVSLFLKRHPSEFLVMLIGSDEGGKWSELMKHNYMQIIRRYPNLFIEDFRNDIPLSSVRGKILVVKRQAECPYGKHLRFTDNAIFHDNDFYVEDVYRQHKTYKKIQLVEEHLRTAYEDNDPSHWYWTFNSIAWDPRHHKPYYSAWGAVNVRKPMNKSLREVLENKAYTQFGVIFLDFYSDHGDNNRLVKRIISSNFTPDKDSDFLTPEDIQ